jgi:hypothetical protein
MRIIVSMASDPEPEETVVIRQLPQLPGRGRNEFFAAIAGVDAPEARHAIQNLVAIDVVDINAVCPRDNATLFLTQILMIGKRVQIVIAIEILPLGTRAVLNHRHD